MDSAAGDNTIMVDVVPSKPSVTLVLPPIEASRLLESSDIDQRGFSRKLHKLVSQHRKNVEKSTSLPIGKLPKREKFEPRNWRQLTERELKNLHPVQQSKFLMYEPTPKDIVEKQMESLKRVRIRNQLKKESTRGLSLDVTIEMEENSELIGQLKAAEARGRIRDAKVSYDRDRKAELQHLIKSQPTAKDAVRLQSFIPPSPIYVSFKDHLSRPERFRCESLLEDDLGLTVKRT